jgi:sugar fermentation stimulation protein A
MTDLRTFRPDLRATFVDRPNRFVVRVLAEGRLLAVHCPNPGRLSELLFPGDSVVLEKAATVRKLSHTLVAVERPGPDPVTIPLVSVRANPAVGALVLPRWFPHARLVRPEFTLGGSRFDWYVEDARGRRHLIEVKACSEVEYGTALFPDAPSDRARKHLEELAAWGDQGYTPHVVFAVVHGRPRWWGPNGHTDPAFARTLAALAPRLNLHAVVFATDAGGTTGLVDADLAVNLPDPGPDAGHLVRLSVGEGGWTVAVDWHADGFERAGRRAPARLTFAVRGPRNRRDELAAALAATLPSSTPDPRTVRAFVDVVMLWRHAPPA